MTAGRGRSGRGRSGNSASPREWIGSRLLLPAFVHDREEPYRPELAIWVEEPSGLVVGSEVVAPEDTEGAVGRALLAAFEQPLAGPPRRPDTIRVPDATVAGEVRAAIGDAIPVVVAPTPELDALFEAMVESMPVDDEGASYLGHGRIPPPSVEELFKAARTLYAAAPWKVATDDHVLRIDIPELCVEGACVCIIGNLGQELGILVFPSLDGFDAFERAAGNPLASGRPLDLGTGWLALVFERGADVPVAMRREIAAHGWPLANADAYPQLARWDRDGTSRPLVERDLKIAAAIAVAISAFYVKHRGLFTNDGYEPVSESWFNENDREVRITMPYEAFALFDEDAALARETAPAVAATRRIKPGRNQPCPCGSGRKYKKCHLDLDEKERLAEVRGDATHDLDQRLVEDLQRFALGRFGDAWLAVTKDFFDAEESQQLSVPWSVYGYHVEGASALDWYLEERGRRLSPPEREWLEAQRMAWLSVWEVIDVDPGVSLTLRDLLCGETRSVCEVLGSQNLVARDALLARVVDHGDKSLLCGSHPRPLPPFEAAEVVRRARGRLRRRHLVPVERLRDEPFGRYLIRRWEDAVEDLDARPRFPTSLCNTDGDPLLLTADHFDVVAGAKPDVEARLATLEGADRVDDGEGPCIFRFVASGASRQTSLESTLIGQARLTSTTLRVETNSRARADALRARIEAACGDRVSHRAREHADPLSEKAPRKPCGPEPELPPEFQQLVREHKQNHYADWVDQSLPALGGETPREAVQTAQGRRDVDVLLKDMENHEQRFGGVATFDFSQLRRQLGLE